jgi:hypothetical protein
MNSLKFMAETRVSTSGQNNVTAELRGIVLQLRFEVLCDLFNDAVSSVNITKLRRYVNEN